MDKKTIKTFFGFSGRVIIAHCLTYFFVGVFFYFTGLNFLVYFENNPNSIVTVYMQHFHPLSSIWVLAGPLFQPIRGLIFALALFPFRRFFIERKWGWVYLWGLFLALAIFGPAGPPPGSIEGFVYTNLPVMAHLIALPEILLQTLAFSWLVVAWEHHKGKKLTIPLVVVFILTLTMSILGVIMG
jgi:hypothetical protein